MPQSYEWATVGGCAATRSAGQTSTGHGRFDEQVVALECVTPAGSLATLGRSGHGGGAVAAGAGPGLRGDAGRDHARSRCACGGGSRPPTTRWSVGSFMAGRRAAAAPWSRTGSRRTSRGCPTRRRRGSTLALAGDRARWGGGCWTGAACWCAAGRARTAAPRRRGKLVRGGAMPLGPSPGHAWEKSRFAGPHLRDDLLDRGVVVETLETATTWSNLERLYGAVRGALPGLHVGCHVSHLYPTGASLYFTVLGAQSDDPVAQWQRGQGRGVAGDRRARRDDHPPPRGRPRPRPVPARRGRRAGDRAAARA